MALFGAPTAGQVDAIIVPRATEIVGNMLDAMVLSLVAAVNISPMKTIVPVGHNGPLCAWSDYDRCTIFYCPSRRGRMA